MRFNTKSLGKVRIRNISRSDYYA